ncbi:putative endonuclease [Geobacter sp. OR-1]|uniref:endonuclease III domain-containing protein n=1 Tax=Geobacter sp. OR-1 TaxID=1266765 RepID=UPI00054334E8|nr:endonuclease III domain-containing protein [Geobacter sp. OR-1]GAM09231.1 putative endonuclease [Geobacter sp. OR-1]
MTSLLLDIYERLYRRFGPCRWWPADTPFEVCVGAILTQNTNWANVEKALANLKQEDLLTPEGIRALPQDRLSELIRPAGFLNVKTKRLKCFVDWLWERYAGRLDLMSAEPLASTRDELLAVHGIGRETCDSILLYAGNYPTFVVDAYTGRLFTRLGIIGEGSGYEEIRTLFMSRLESDPALYNEYHALIVMQCKEYCRKRPFCSACVLQEICNFPGN